ncbi:MAG: ImmA/IrrE family metallo-endopeptidase [Desulfovibrionaceae bacterium]
MNDAKREKINKLASIVRDACNLEIPIDLDRAVCCLQGKIKRENNADFEAKVEKVDDGFVISVAAEASGKRERFSIAHELGHLFLHMGYMIDEDKWRNTSDYHDSVYYRFGHSIEEYEAHEFAAALLMPRDEFIEIAKKNLNGDAYSVAPIAEYFDVTVSAAKTRGRWLGLFSWDD